jgi:hypothetical protein
MGRPSCAGRTEPARTRAASHISHMASVDVAGIGRPGARGRRPRQQRGCMDQSSTARGREAADLMAEVVALPAAVVADATSVVARMQLDASDPSSLDLTHYLALRRHDLRSLQRRLMLFGLSSLRRHAPHWPKERGKSSETAPGPRPAAKVNRPARRRRRAGARQVDPLHPRHSCARPRPPCRGSRMRSGRWSRERALLTSLPPSRPSG